jgi:hypothetical protein
MAERIVKWTLDGAILKLSKYTNNKEAAVIIEAEFDLNDLLEVMSNKKNQDFTMQALTYLAKQKLMDSGASNIGDFGGKILAAKNRWKELLEAQWKGERINATGAAETKRLEKEAKEASKVISLEGLSVKKLLYPSTFTAEDEAKLQELIAAAAAVGKN